MTDRHVKTLNATLDPKW